MKISEIYQKPGNHISFEIFPPKGDLEPETLSKTLDALSSLHPEFISVTCSAGGSGGSIDKTIDLADIVSHTHGITASSHLTCIHSTHEDIEYAVQKLKEKKIENILALRGDLVEGKQTKDFKNASELIAFLKKFDICIGAACYPEGHVTCESVERDIEFMKHKEDVGADFFISQLFFDNDIFYKFREKTEKAGITRPIAAGIMPFLSKAQITRMIFNCGASLPAEIIRILVKYENDAEALRSAGIAYATQQILDLLANDVRYIHIYTMNQPDIAHSIMGAIQRAGYTS